MCCHIHLRVYFLKSNWGSVWQAQSFHQKAGLGKKHKEIKELFPLLENRGFLRMLQMAKGPMSFLLHNKETSIQESR